MKILIQGYSGCKLEIVKKKKNFVIKKITTDFSYKERLKKQVKKQQIFYKKNPFSFILVPEVLSEKDRGSYSFEMTYFPSLDFISYFQQAEKGDIDLCVSYFKNYIEFLVSNSSMETFTSEVIHKKYREVKQKSLENEYTKNKFLLFEKLDSFFSSVPKLITIPTGFCHGDLTFSNILFNKRKKDLVLIDFLDSFIETPLQDMVKLRQDTKYHWSLHFSNKEFDQTKVTIVFDYLDKILDSFFKQYSFYNDHYYLFQVLNFTRILPYVKTPEIADYLDITLTALIQEKKLVT